jgi:hypothetical protein
MARPSKLDRFDAWMNENEAAFDAACAGLIAPDRAAHVLYMLTIKAKPNGTCDPTYEQLAKPSRLSIDKLKNVMKVLTTVGAIETIEKARGPGANGGKGRAPVRQVSFLKPIEAATGDAEALWISQNRYVVNGEQVRSEPGIGTQSATYPYGSSPTVIPPNSARAANAEPAQLIKGGIEAHKREGQCCGYPAKWEDRLLAYAGKRASEQLEVEGNGPTSERKQQAKARKAKARLQELGGTYKRLVAIRANTEPWYQLGDILAFYANDRKAPENAYTYLDAYRE